MYNVPPIFSYTLSRLMYVCQERIKVYKRIEKFLETHRLNENEQKNFYDDLEKAIEKS